MSEGDVAPADVAQHALDFDLADEDQIISEMSGRVSDNYVYTFKQGGKDVTGLSFAGTNWAVREYAKQGEVIRIVGAPHVVMDPTDPDYVFVTITAQRFAVNVETGKDTALDSTIGVKRQWKMMEKRKYDDSGALTGKDLVQDSFYFEKAVSKATRNAKQALIPADFVKKLIDKAIQSKNGKTIQPRKGTQQAKVGDGTPQSQAAPKAIPIQQPATPTQTVQTQPAQGTAMPIQGPAPVPTTATQQVNITQTTPQAPAPGPQAPPPAIPKDVMVQKLDAVLKMVFKTQDGAIARQGLFILTGFQSPSDMEVDKIQALGNTLNAVLRSQAKVQANQIIRIQDNAILWQGPPMAGPVVDPNAMF